jgi:hypothetical protein
MKLNTNFIFSLLIGFTFSSCTPSKNARPLTGHIDRNQLPIVEINGEEFTVSKMIGPAKKKWEKIFNEEHNFWTDRINYIIFKKAVKEAAGIAKIKPNDYINKVVYQNIQKPNDRELIHFKELHPTIKADLSKNGPEKEKLRNTVYKMRQHEARLKFVELHREKFSIKLLYTPPTKAARQNSIEDEGDEN